MRSATAEAEGSRKAETNWARAESSQAVSRIASEAPRASIAGRKRGPAHWRHASRRRIAAR